MRYRAIMVGMVLAFSIADAQQPAGRNVAIESLQSAIASLRDSAINRKILSFNLNAYGEKSGSRYHATTGTVEFGRFDGAFFCDVSELQRPVPHESDGESETSYIQAFLSHADRLRETNYSFDKKSRKFATEVSCSPKSNYDQDVGYLASRAKLEWAFADVDMIGMELAQIASNSPSIESTSSPTTARAVFSTRYGPVTLAAELREGHWCLTDLIHDQAASDYYTKKLPDTRLSMVKSLGRVPLKRGISSQKLAIIITWNRQSASSPAIDAIRREWTRSADEIKLVEVVSMKCTGVVPLKSLEDLTNRNIPIPDGSRVYAGDEEYHSVYLAFRSGQIVREVDGASLDQVVAEVEHGKRNRLIYWIVGGTLAAFVIIVSIYFWFRRRRAHRGAAA